jgi:hypothetical protein
LPNLGLGKASHGAVLLLMRWRWRKEVVERIRTLLGRFPEDEEAVHQLVARDVSFDALCNEYGKVIKLLDAFEAQIKLLRARRAWLEEELLTRTEGYQPH